MSVYTMNRKDTVVVLKRLFAKMLASKALYWELKVNAAASRGALYDFTANWKSPHQNLSVTPAKKRRRR